MPASAQDWLAAALATIAGGWLLWRAWRRRRPAAGACAGCEHCPLATGPVAGAAREPAIPGFVPLESLRRAK